MAIKPARPESPQTPLHSRVVPSNDVQEPEYARDVEVSGRAPAMARPIGRVLLSDPAPPPGEAPPVRIFDVESGHFCFAFYRNVSFVLWHEAADGPAVRRLAQMTEHLNRLYPGGHSCISFVRPGCAMPDDEARELMASLFDGSVSQVRCLSVVVEGEGFWASALRSTVTQLQRGGRHSRSLTQVRLDTSILGAAAWMADAHSRDTDIPIMASQLALLAEAARDDMRMAVQPQHY